MYSVFESGAGVEVESQFRVSNGRNMHTNVLVVMKVFQILGRCRQRRNHSACIELVSFEECGVGSEVVPGIIEQTVGIGQPVH